MTHNPDPQEPEEEYDNIASFFLYYIAFPVLIVIIFAVLVHR